MGRKNLRVEPAVEVRDAIGDRREFIETILRRAEHLPPPDRSLLTAVFDRGMTATDLANAIDDRPKTVRKRIGRLLQRLDSPGFRYVIRNRRYWNSECREIAEAVFLRGETQRSVASRFGFSLHRVRQEVHRLRALFETEPFASEKK